MTDWIDVSVAVRKGMPHWPGDPAFHIHRVADQTKGDVCTVSQMDLGVHTGTHMDAPLHFLSNGACIDELPLDATVGPARVIEIHNPVAISQEDLLPHHLQAGQRILFKTSNSIRAWEHNGFYEDFVYIAQDAARYLAGIGVRTVGVDYLSVGGYRKDSLETHVALLEAGIWIIEGLNLKHIVPGDYDLICLPMKLEGAEGAPARAILRSRA